MSRPIQLLTILGARPQFIKAAALDRTIKSDPHRRIEEIILHTGQHYDTGMSKVFFDELKLPRPHIELNVGSGTHAIQTARMLEGIGKAIGDVRPDAVVVYGDTNSTLAGAIAAAKMQVPIAHIEAGLRSFNKGMPEEINRILTDQCSTWLFCPTRTAMNNLQREGIGGAAIEKASIDRPKAILSGDVMLDNILHFAELADRRSTLIKELGLRPGKFFLATIHRAANTDDPKRLSAIIDALRSIAAKHGMPVVLPLHPRTKERLERIGVDLRSVPGLHLTPPAGFMEMIALEKNAGVILTDSGGVQKEAYFLGRPCVILREETEWTEIVEAGMAILADADPERIIGAVDRSIGMGSTGSKDLFGDGRAAERICEELISTFEG